MDILRRSIQQILRFKIRNGLILIQLIITTVLLTSLSAFIYQLDQLYKDENSPFYEKLTFVKIWNEAISDELFSYLNDNEDIEFYFAQSTFFPLSELYMDMNDFYIYPKESKYSNDIQFYDPDRTKGLKNLTSHHDENQINGVIVPNDFKTNLISKEHYNKIYGASELPESRFLKNYHSLSLEQEITTEGYEGQEIRFRLFDVYTSEEIETLSLPITGVFQSENPYISDDDIFIPIEYKQFFFKNRDTSLKYMVIQSRSLSMVPNIIEEIKRLGYKPTDELYLRGHMENNKNLLLDLVPLVVILALITLICSTFILYSSLKERNKETGIMKAIGIGNKKFIFLFSLEVILLTSTAVMVGFVIVESLFTVIQNLIQTGTISSDYYEFYSLDQLSALYLFETPMKIYGIIFLLILSMNVLIYYILVSNFYKKSIAVLMK